MSLFKKASMVARQEGVMMLCQKTLRYTYTQLYLKIENIYFDLKETQTLSIDGTTAKFNGKTASGGPLLRESFRRENEFLSEVVSDLRQDDIFWDVGANLGLFAAFAGEIISDGQIVAIEPYPKNINQLEKNIQYNTSAFEVIPQALSNKNGEVRLDFRYRDHNTTGAKSVSISDKSGSESITVDATTGDDLVSKGMVPPPTVIKMDIEGAEAVAIKGMRDILHRGDCRLLYIEVHLPGASSSIQEFGMDYSSLVSLIEEYGFEIAVLDRTENRVHLKAIK